MGEWASVRSKVYSTGYSPRKGQVRNPFDLRKSPFGSSSGSAAAVSANIVPLSIGTETDTSIIGPAGINGVVGIKPTVGLTSRNGVIPISENMDSVGTFGRTVADATFGLSVIVGSDDRDQFTQSPFRKQANDYTQFLAGKEVLKGARFGLPIRRCWELAPPHCKEVALKVLDAIRDAGAEIVDVDFPSVEDRIGPEGTWNWEHGEPSKSEWTVAKIDAYNGINRYLRELSNTPIRTVEDILTYNQRNEGTEGPLPGKVPAFPSGQVCHHSLLPSLKKVPRSPRKSTSFEADECRTT
jgi:amidase